MPNYNTKPALPKRKKVKVIITRNRDYTINSNILRNRLFVYNGKTDKHVKVNKSLIGTKLGALSFTKKTGKGIHDSVKNRKRKNKKNQKK